MLGFITGVNYIWYFKYEVVIQVNYYHKGEVLYFHNYYAELIEPLLIKHKKNELNNQTTSNQLLIS